LPALRPFLDMGIGRVHHQFPAGPEAPGREGELHALVPRVEEDQQGVVGHGCTVGVALRYGVAVEEYTERLGVALLPLLVGHLVAAGVEPGDVAHGLASEGPSLEPLAAP